MNYEYALQYRKDGEWRDDSYADEHLVDNSLFDLIESLAEPYENDQHLLSGYEYRIIKRTEEGDVIKDIK